MSLSQIIHKRPRVGALLCVLLCFSSLGCRRSATAVIAVIPRTSGTMAWEPEHRGAEDAALAVGTRIYWNGPIREDDLEGQIALVNRVSAGGYQGLVLAPDHPLALLTPIRRAVSMGLSTVIIGAQLSIQPGATLAYVVNDEEEGARLAAQRLSFVLHGHGIVAVLGVNADIPGVVTRARNLSSILKSSYPGVRIADLRGGTFNLVREEEVAEEALKQNADLDAIVCLTPASTHAVIAALGDRSSGQAIHVIAFDPESLEMGNASLDSLILQDTRHMGEVAVMALYGRLHGRAMPAVTKVEPFIVTRDNLNSERVRSLTSMEWRPEPLPWSWSARP